MGEKNDSERWNDVIEAIDGRIVSHGKLYSYNVDHNMKHLAFSF